MVEIEDGYPIPTKWIKQKWPWRELEIGQSFHCTVPHSHQMCYDWSKKTGKKFIARGEGDGYRVWRIA